MVFKRISDWGKGIFDPKIKKFKGEKEIRFGDTSLIIPLHDVKLFSSEVSNLYSDIEDHEKELLQKKKDVFALVDHLNELFNKYKQSQDKIKEIQKNNEDLDDISKRTATAGMSASDNYNHSRLHAQNGKVKEELISLKKELEDEGKEIKILSELISKIITNSSQKLTTIWNEYEKIIKWAQKEPQKIHQEVKEYVQELEKIENSRLGS